MQGSSAYLRSDTQIGTLTTTSVSGEPIYVRSRADSNPVPHPPIGLKYERMRPVRDAIRDDVEKLSLVIQHEPTTSTRKISARVDGKRTTVFLCFKEDLNLNPYRYRKTEVLREYKKIIGIILLDQ